MGNSESIRTGILVVDDDADVLTAVRLLLKPHFPIVRTEGATSRLTDLIRSGQYGVVLLDMNFAIGAESGAEGLDWLTRIVELDPRVAVVLITAHGDVATAVEAMKRGATDFVVKPWNNDRLVAVLKGAAAMRRARLGGESRRPSAAEPTARSEIPMIAESPVMRRVMDLVRRAAPTEANVLVVGENGTGKELIAQALHVQSNRAKGPFVAIDLGAVAASLFESELFGHRKGSFTDARDDRIGRFQAAQGGTLFLDEIGNLPLALQAKLLTVIERREVTPVGANRADAVDVRLICATNLSRAELADPARFRPDLLYRINTVELALPPLRERPDDIQKLAEAFAAHYAAKYNMPAKPLAPQALALMRADGWPGNVRALRHAIERATILSEGVVLDVCDFALEASNAAVAAAPEDDAALSLSALERRAVERALQKSAGNVSHAAQRLGLTRASLYRRLEKYGL